MLLLQATRASGVPGNAIRVISVAKHDAQRTSARGATRVTLTTILEQCAAGVARHEYAGGVSPRRA